MNFQFLEKKTFVLLFGGVLIGVVGIGLLQFIVMYPFGLLQILFLRPGLFIFLILVQFVIGCGIGLFIWNRLPVIDSIPPEPNKTFPKSEPGDKKKTSGQKTKQSKPKLPRSIVVEFPPVVEDALPNIREIQIGCMRHVFGRLGIEYLPMLCTDIIDEMRQDPIPCLFKFLSKINIDPDELLIKGSVEERVRFETIIGILLEADDIRRDFNVSPIPIYKALGISIDEAELLLDKMRDVADLLKTMSEKEKVFFKYKRWFQDVQEMLEHWEQYDSNELQEVFEVAKKFDGYQIQFDSYLEDITVILDKLKELRNWDSISEEVNEKIEALDVTISRMCEQPSDENRELDIELGLKMLQIIFETLSDLFKNNGGNTVNAGDQIKEKVIKALQLLGLEYGAPFAKVKSIFRKMALKTHPDTNKSPDAEQKMKELNNAWEVLRNFYKNVKEDFAYV